MKDQYPRGFIHNFAFAGKMKRKEHTLPDACVCSGRGWTGQRMGQGWGSRWDSTGQGPAFAPTQLLPA